MATNSRKHHTCAVLTAFYLAAMLAMSVSGCGNGNKSESGNTYTDAAERHISSGNFEKAIESLEKSIQLEPEEASAYLKLALIYEGVMADRGKAREYYGKYIEIETDETLRGEAEGWLAGLDESETGDSAAGSGESGTLARLAVESSRKQHERDLAQMRAEYEREIARLKTEITAREEEIAVAKAKAAASGEASASGDSSSKAGSSNDARLKSEVARLQKELAAVKKRLADSGKDLVAAENSGAGHLEEVSNLRKALKSKEDDYEALVAKYAELQKEYTEAVDLAKRLSSERSDAGTQNGGSEHAASGTNRSVPGVKEIKGSTIYYEVQQKDTLRGIAEKFYGDRRKWSVIFNENRDRVSDEDDIKAGQILKIPILK